MSSATAPHAPIAGHRGLSQAELEAINRIKELGAQLGAELIAVATRTDLEVDPRALAIARTELQTGLMWAVRAVAKPAGF